MFSVTVPSWRATKDISIKDDLVEEVGRMIGYGSITPTSPLLPAVVPPQRRGARILYQMRGNWLRRRAFTRCTTTRS